MKSLRRFESTLTLSRDFHETAAAARDIWSNALRSGQFGRCRTFLSLLTPTGDVRYSSLGVACEEFRKRYPDRIGTNEVGLAAAGYLCIEYNADGAVPDRFYLPDLVRHWLGMSDMVGTLRPHYSHLGFRTFCELDDDNISFEKLADLIDADVLVTSDAARNTASTTPRRGS